MNEEKQAILGEICALKSLLTDTDYQAIKHSEGVISDEDYAPIKAQRAAWRARINELQGELDETEENQEAAE